MPFKTCGLKVRLAKDVFYLQDVHKPHSDTVEGFTNGLSTKFSEVTCVSRHKFYIVSYLIVILLNYNEAQRQVSTIFMRTIFSWPKI